MSSGHWINWTEIEYVYSKQDKGLDIPNACLASYYYMIQNSNQLFGTQPIDKLNNVMDQAFDNLMTSTHTRERTQVHSYVQPMK